MLNVVPTTGFVGYIINRGGAMQGGDNPEAQALVVSGRVGRLGQTC